MREHQSPENDLVGPTSEQSLLEQPSNQRDSARMFIADMQLMRDGFCFGSADQDSGPFESFQTIKLLWPVS